MTTEAPAKLPVWKTALECYRLTFRHLGDLLRFAWPWLLLLVAVSGALYWALYPLEKDALAKTGSGSNTLWFLTLLASTAIGAFIAVPWHRLLILGERPELAEALKLDNRHWLYLWRAFLLGVLPLAPLLLMLTLFHSGLESAVTESMTEAETTSLIATISGFLLFLLICLAAGRFSPILPATALAHNGVGWRNSWDMTRNNTWRLFWISLILSLPFVIAGIVAAGFDLNAELKTPSEAIKAPVNEFAGRTSFTLWSVAMEFAGMLFGMLFVTFLSLAYRHFKRLAAPESKNSAPPAP